MLREQQRAHAECVEQSIGHVDEQLRPHADFLDKEKEFDARVAAMRMPPA